MVTVSDGSSGGAEQVLWSLERELAARGLATAVAASKGTVVSGELLDTGAAPTEPDRFEERERRHSEAIIRMCRQRRFRLVHDKSGHFWRHAARIRQPVLATLHLPRSFYSPALFTSIAPNVFFNCVSEPQASEFRDLPNFLGVVPNGIAVERFPLVVAKRDYFVWIGRICPEKGTHLALDVVQRLAAKLILIGSVYPFSWHQEYFEREIRPRLEAAGPMAEFVESPSFARKVELLSHARALLIPALAAETSSLVAMEAMACGTPVVAFTRGALPEVIRHEKTGFLVNDLDGMADAIGRVSRIDPKRCRAEAATRFSAKRMADGYMRLYSAILKVAGPPNFQAA